MLNYISRTFLTLFLAEMISNTSAFAVEAIIGNTESSKTETEQLYKDVVTNNYLVRSTGRLFITNRRGAITVKGWNQDKIRIISTRMVFSKSEAESKKQIQMIAVRYRDISGDIEISADFGRNLKLEDKLLERKLPAVRVDLEIWAPSNLELRTWAMDHDIKISSWKNNVDIRSSTGGISLEKIDGNMVSIICQSCPMILRDVKSSIRCAGGSKNIVLLNIVGASVYVETTSGSLEAMNVDSVQTYVSRTGNIKGDVLKGKIEFRSDNGTVEFRKSRGFLSGRTDTSDIYAEMSDWTFKDKALVESETGTIHLILPADLSAEMDLKSITGEIQTAFDLQPIHQKSPDEEFNGKRLHGRIGTGGDLFNVYSRAGNIKIEKNH